MRVEMHGHANLLVQSRAGAVLFDPLFFGEHHEGVYDIYPPREFDLQKIGLFDAVVISHAHADHFDPASVALLPRRVPVITPRDAEIVACLRGLGFQKIVEAQNFEPIQVGAIELIPTPAAAGAPEHGFLLRDGESTVWNMVDTFPSSASIEQVLARYGPIDLLFAPWQPLHDTAVASGGAPAFPHGMYGRILSMIARINPRVLIPGACGFWAVGAAAWTNKLIFPLSRERFLVDLAHRDAELAQRVTILEPGDSLMVTPRGVSHEQGLVACVKRERDYDWRDRAFRPLDLVGMPVVEHRGDVISEAECGDAVRSFFEEALPEFVAENSRAFDGHGRWQLIRQYEVVFHDDVRRCWTLSFGPGGLKVEAGESPLRTALTVITAGLLVSLIAGSRSWDYAQMSGELRRFDFSYHVDERGLHLPHAAGLSDPLLMMLGSPSEREFYQAQVIEALDERYRESLREAGLDPDEVLKPSPQAPMASATELIDPTAIAAQVMKQLQVISLDGKKHGQYSAAVEEPSEHEKHDAS